MSIDNMLSQNISLRLLPIAKTLPTACMDVTALDYIYYHVGLTFVCRTIVLLPDAKELPDANAVHIGTLSLTRAEEGFF